MTMGQEPTNNAISGNGNSNQQVSSSNDMVAEYKDKSQQYGERNQRDSEEAYQS